MLASQTSNIKHHLSHFNELNVHFFLLCWMSFFFIVPERENFSTLLSLSQLFSVCSTGLFFFIPEFWAPCVVSSLSLYSQTTPGGFCIPILQSFVCSTCCRSTLVFHWFSTQDQTVFWSTGTLGKSVLMCCDVMADLNRVLWLVCSTRGCHLVCVHVHILHCSAVENRSHFTSDI